MPPHVYKPLGCCMYCLRSAAELAEAGERELSLEHIIPFALNGRLELPEAVCEPCQSITGKPEQRALDADLLVPRLLLDLKRRRAKRKAPKRLPFVAFGNHLDNLDADDFAIELTAEQYPPTFVLLSLRMAGLLSGDVDLDGSLRGPRFIICHLGIPTARPTETITTRENRDHSAFAYLLAKIAYAYAVAEAGLGAFDGGPIRELLAGARPDIFNFVGGPAADEPGTRAHLHRLAIRRRGEWLTVVVHLFASTGVPNYEVVVGRAL